MAIRYSAKLNKNCNSFPPGIITPSTVVPIDQIQKFDSVHDFGSTRGNNLATDSISKSKDTGNSSGNYAKLRWNQYLSQSNDGSILH